MEGEVVPGLKVRVKRSPHPKCERCWTFEETVGKEPAHPGLCSRCVSVMKVMGQ